MLQASKTSRGEVYNLREEEGKKKKREREREREREEG